MLPSALSQRTRFPVWLQSDTNMVGVIDGNMHRCLCLCFAVIDRSVVFVSCAWNVYIFSYLISVFTFHCL